MKITMKITDEITHIFWCQWLRVRNRDLFNRGKWWRKPSYLRKKFGKFFFQILYSWNKIWVIILDIQITKYMHNYQIYMQQWIKKFLLMNNSKHYYYLYQIIIIKITSFELNTTKRCGFFFNFFNQYFTLYYIILSLYISRFIKIYNLFQKSAIIIFLKILPA
jgi:hypothetical protein